MTTNTGPAQRDVMEYDVAVVGAGPAGLAMAIRLKQLKPELSVCVLEKGSTVGAHSLSGAVLEPGPLDKLLPEWRNAPLPIRVPVTQDEFRILGPSGSTRVPWLPSRRLRNAPPGRTQNPHSAINTALGSAPVRMRCSRGTFQITLSIHRSS
jgi:choline dehydrogenase-like flavoprotein